MGLVTWFEIPVVDVERAMVFYEYVFEVELERTVIDGHPMALFPEADEPGRVGGAHCLLLQMQQETPIDTRLLRVVESTST